MHMIKKLGLVIFAIAATAGLSVSATPAFDGDWFVEVNAQSGHCDQSYRVPITVSSGEISYSGRFSVQASGAVDGAGSLNVQLAHGGEVVDARGRLATDWGRGEWSSATLNCSGTWLARRG